MSLQASARYWCAYIMFCRIYARLLRVSSLVILIGCIGYGLGCSSPMHKLLKSLALEPFAHPTFIRGPKFLHFSLMPDSFSSARVVCESVHNFGHLGRKLHDFLRWYWDCMGSGFSVLGFGIRLKSGQLFVILTHQHSSR